MGEFDRLPAGITYTALCRALMDAARKGDDARKERVYQAIETLRQEFPEAVAIEDQMWGGHPQDPRSG